MANDLKIKITTEGADKAIKEVDTLSKSINNLEKEVNEIDGGGVETLTSSLEGMVGTIANLLKAMAVFETAKAVFNFEEEAAKAQQSSEAFNSVFTELGKNAEEEFAKIKEASKGLIPDSVIQQAAVSAESLGVPIENLSELMEIARAKARDMGTDVATAFGDLVTGIGRGSTEILDNLGLTVKLEESYTKFAATVGKSADALTAAEKKQALVNDVIEQGAKSVDRYKDASLSASEKTQGFGAALKNLQVQVGKELIPAFSKLKDVSTEYLKSIDEGDVAKLSDTFANIGHAIVGVYDAMKVLNDVVVPDWLGGDGTGFFDTVAEGWGKIFTAIGEVSKRADKVADAFVALDNVDYMQRIINGVSEAVDKFGGLQAQYDLNAESLKKLLAENLKFQEALRGIDTEAARAALAELEKQEKQLMDISLKLAKQKPVETEAAKKSADLKKKYSADTLSEIEKNNKKEIDLSNKKISTLLLQEKKMQDDILKLKQNYLKTLEGIENDRFNTILDIEGKIRDIQYGGMSEIDEYNAKRKDADTAYYNAKEALAQGDLEKYKTYIAEYERLATEYGDKAVEVEGVVLVSKEETARGAIEALNKIKALELQYFEAKASLAKSDYEQQLAIQTAALENTKIQLEGYKALLLAQQQLAEAQGQKVNVDLSAIDALIAKIGVAKSNIDNIAKTPVVAKVTFKPDATAVEAEKQKQAATVTVTKIVFNPDTNEYEQEETQILESEEKKIVFNPDTNEYQEVVTDISGEEVVTRVILDPSDKELKAAKESAAKPVSSEVVFKANTKASDTAKTEAKKPVESTVKFNPKTEANNAARAAAAKPITVPVYYKPMNSPPKAAAAEGGLIPRFAGGGSFRGSGRVPGYDPTDSDKVTALLTGGEYVIRRRAVDMYGLSFLNALNSMKLPKMKGYADGGLVGAPTPSSNLQPVTINLSGGGSFNAKMSPREVEALLQYSLVNYGGK